MLRIRNRIWTRATLDYEVFVESETAPSETVPLAEGLMQIEVLRGTNFGNFGTKYFVALKDKGLVLAT